MIDDHRRGRERRGQVVRRGSAERSGQLTSWPDRPSARAGSPAPRGGERAVEEADAARDQRARGGPGRRSPYGQRARSQAVWSVTGPGAHAGSAIAPSRL